MIRLYVQPFCGSEPSATNRQIAGTP